MARLKTIGYETGIVNSGLAGSGSGGDEGGSAFSGATLPVIDTAIFRSGERSIKCDAAGKYQIAGAPTVLDRTNYYRAYVRFNQAPAVATRIFDANGTNWRVNLDTSRRLELRDSANALIGSVSAVLAVDTWYRIEIKVMHPTAGAGVIELRLDGSTVASSAAASVGNTGSGWRVGWVAAAAGAGFNLHVDDVAVNDDQGAAQNSWCGEGKVVLLRAVSDVSRVGWTGGAGATTSLFEAVNNVPPVGVDDAVATDASQIVNANANTTDTYVARTAAYTASLASGGGGMGASDVVTLVRPMVRIGGQSTTTRSVAYRMEANPGPSSSEGSQGTGSTAGATEPDGWTTAPVVAAITHYAPAPTLSNGADVRVRKATSNVDKVMVDLLGVMVEYVPSAGAALTASVSDSVALDDAVGKGSAIVKADAVGLGDSPLKGVGVSRTEAVSLADDVRRGIGIGRAETVPLADEVRESMSLALADAVGVSDAVTRAWVAQRAVADTVSPSDAAALGLAKTIAETVGLADATAFVRFVALLVADTVIVADALTKRPGLRAADAVAIADAVALANLLVIGDSVTVADAIQRAWAARRSVAEAVALVDGLSRRYGLMLADTVALVDAAVLGEYIPPSGIPGWTTTSTVGSVNEPIPGRRSTVGAGSTGDASPGRRTITTPGTRG